MQVYDSLKASGKISPEKMAVFDSEEAADQLSYMRYLPVAARPATAIYIVDNNLDGVVSCLSPPLSHIKARCKVLQFSLTSSCVIPSYKQGDCWVDQHFIIIDHLVESKLSHTNPSELESISKQALKLLENNSLYSSLHSVPCLWLSYYKSLRGAGRSLQC